MVLYVNGTLRRESRTDRIARALLEKLGGEYTEVTLKSEKLLPLSEKSLEKRNKLIGEGRFGDKMFAYARQFAEADEIVISAPYYDMSFPACLKNYIENICVMGIASKYSDEGIPVGLCRAKKLWYVTTAGGCFVPDFSYDQISALAKGYFGIPETELIKAECLDIVGTYPEKAVSEVIASIQK